METKRLLLRELVPADAETVFSMTSQPEVARFMRFGTHTSLSEARGLIQELTAAPNLGWLILERETGSPVGVFACKGGDGPDAAPGEFGLSTFTTPAYWNHGYSTEVLAAMLPVLRQKGMGALTAHVVADNRGSRRVLEKNGFTEWKTLFFPDLPQGLIVYRLEL